MFFLSSGFLFNAYSHLDTTSLSLKGGETFMAGDTVKITWKIAVVHKVPIVIYLSLSPEDSWVVLDTLVEPSGSRSMSYTWIVPDKPATSARIRIFQKFTSRPGETGNDYTIISGRFTIKSTATPATRPAAIRPARPVFHTNVIRFYNLKGRIFPSMRINGSSIRSHNLFLGNIR